MRFIIARHAETVFNAEARMQGQMAHTPLTRRGIAQAEAMGVALASFLANDSRVNLWASPAGRTLQTAAIIAEHLARDYFSIRTDTRLLEIDVGAWQGHTYAEVIAEQGPILCPERRLFTACPPGGEWYPAIADRLCSWIAELDPARDVLLVSHGMALRVLRGLLAGGAPFEGVPIAEDAPQGTIFVVEDGVSTPVHVGLGAASGGAL